LLSADLAMGYPLLDTKKSRVTPFAAIITCSSTCGNQKKYEDHQMDNFACGLGIDLIIKSDHSQPNGTSNEKTDWFIRTRVYISVVNFNDRFKVP